MVFMVDYKKNENALTIKDQNMFVKVVASLFRSTVGWKYLFNGSRELKLGRSFKI